MKKKPIVRTAVSSVLIAVLLIAAIAVNILLPTYNQIVSSYLGDTAQARKVLCNPGGLCQDQSAGAWSV